MKVNIKLKGATPKFSGESLCKSCSYGSFVRGESLNEEFTKCQYFGKVTFKVTECSAFAEKGAPSLYSLKQEAWYITTTPRGKFVGFLNPNALTKKQRKELELLRDDDD